MHQKTPIFCRFRTRILYGRIVGPYFYYTLRTLTGVDTTSTNAQFGLALKFLFGAVLVGRLVQLIAQDVFYCFFLSVTNTRNAPTASTIDVIVVRMVRLIVFR